MFATKKDLPAAILLKSAQHPGHILCDHPVQKSHAFKLGKERHSVADSRKWSEPLKFIGRGPHKGGSIRRADEALSRGRTDVQLNRSGIESMRGEIHCATRGPRGRGTACKLESIQG